MTPRLNLKGLAAAALISSFTTMATASAEDTSARAPEATATEAEMSFWDIPYLQTAFIETAPADRQDGLVVGKLGVDGGDKATIVKLAEEIAAGQYGEFDSLLIAHKDKLVFESYYLRGRVDLPHFQASATKAYTSLALGRAIELGYLTIADLNKPLVSFFDELDRAKFAEGVELITLHKALTMSTGIRITPEQWEDIRKDPSQIKGQQYVQAMLENTAPITPEAQSFLYGTDPDLVMQVIEAVVPGSAEDFIKTELLDKMGITNYRWQTHINGLPQAGSRASMTSRDMLKLGILAANKGEWNGEQLISEAFINRAKRKIVREADDENFLDHGNVFDTGYGYFFWQADLSTGHKRYLSAAARGGGGQFVIVVDHLDLVIAVTAHDREDDTSSLTGERILPAFIQAVPASTENGNPRAPEATPAEATGSFWDMPVLETAFIDPAPAARADGLPVGALGADGRNPDQIFKLAEEMGARTHGNYDSLLIAHKGKLVFESYYLRGRVNLTHWQGSATKSYVSLIVGRAIQLGYLTMADLDKPLASFLKDLGPSKFVDGAEKITLHQAMTMRSGLRFNEEQMDQFRENSSQFNGLAQIQAFLELSTPITSESQSYRYQSPDPIMVMQVIDAVVPGTARDFIKKEFLDKLGINDYSWRTDLSGLPSGDEGSGVTSRDMIKFGTLVNNKGKWNGEQLISEKYLAVATSGITLAAEDWQPNSFNYGYLWYQTNMIIEDKSYDAKIAWGGGGQYIIIVQELDLIITITGHDGRDTIMKQVSDGILPAFIQ